MTVNRYKTNPFLTDMIVPIKNKRVQLSRLGPEKNILINQNTGESFGTHITTFKRVDSDQFVKLFTQNIALTFDLTASGIKAFNVLMWAVQNTALSKDEVTLDVFALEDFLIYQNSFAAGKKYSLSTSTFWRGLRELEKSKIIAKTLRAGRYFINPNFVFNGDRIAFTTLIERKTDKDMEQEKEENQPENFSLAGQEIDPETGEILG